MQPDIYSGDTCDRIRPRWNCFSEGDKDAVYLNVVELDAKTFPPGTRIIVREPECPRCNMIAELCKSNTSCDFDWEKWTQEQFS